MILRRGRRKRNDWSLRSRIQVLTAAVVTAAVSITAVAVYLVAADGLRERVDQQLINHAEAVTEATFSGDSGMDFLLALSFMNNTDVVVGIKLKGSPENQLTRPSAANEPFGTTEEPIGAPERAVLAGQVDSSLRTRGEYRIYAVRTDNGDMIMIAQSLLPTERLLRRLALILTLVSGFGVTVAALLGTAVARTGLRPVARLLGATRRVAENGDLTPIEVVGEDELADLARRFNEMLAALRASRRRQRRLITAAGQELRTPLELMRTRIDTLIRADRTGKPEMSNKELQEVQADVIAQLDELARIVGDVVDRARLEHLTAVGDTGEHGFVLSDPPSAPVPASSTGEAAGSREPAGTATETVPPTTRKGGRHRRPSRRRSLRRGTGS